MVSRPTYVGGLGFGFKWDMGWMHDTLLHMAREPIHRRYHYDELTFRGVYAWTRELRAAAVARRSRARQGLARRARCRATTGSSSPNLRLLFALPVGDRPGKKLLFMGGEIGAMAGVGPRRHASTGVCSTTTPHAGVAALGRAT